MRIDLLRPWRRAFSASLAERLWRIVPTVIYMALITLSSSVPGQNLPQVVDDRLAHFVVYFGLGAVVLFSVAGFAPEALDARHLVIAALTVAVFAASDEWHQRFVPGRDSSLKDFLFDVAGAGTAQILLWRATGVRP
jgi:VanZ family protein